MWGVVAKRLKVTLLAVAVVVLPVTLVTGRTPQLASWGSGTPAYTQSVKAATIPAPATASGSLGSVSSTVSSSYAAHSYTASSTDVGYWYPQPNWSTTGHYYICSVTGSPGDNTSAPCQKTVYYTAYDCPNGGTLSGTTCYTTTTTTTPAVKFAWTAPTATSTLGQPLAPNVQVVSSTSCTSTSWTTVATVADSTGSYTVSSPSSSDYYAIRTLVGSDWTGPITSCTQG